MATIEIDDELVDKLYIQQLYEVADTQVGAIMIARASIIDYPDEAHGHWADVQDCIEVLAAVNRLLEYHGKDAVDLASAIAEMASDG